MPEEEIEQVAEEPIAMDTPEAAVEEATSEPGDLYSIKVDGSEQQVSLDELRDGYQRQSDYTRKTQELADERRRLSQAESIVTALENDPSATIQSLARTFDVDLGSPRRSAESSSEDCYSDDIDADPEDPTSRRIAQLEARLEQQDRDSRQQAIEKQVVSLQGQYGDFDKSELFSHAVKHGIGNLEAALTHMRYSDVAGEAQKLKSELEVFEKKRDASMVESGGSKQPSAVPASEGTPSSIREAFAMALKQHAN